MKPRQRASVILTLGGDCETMTQSPDDLLSFLAFLIGRCLFWRYWSFSFRRLAPCYVSSIHSQASSCHFRVVLRLIMTTLGGYLPLHLSNISLFLS